MSLTKVDLRAQLKQTRLELADVEHTLQSRAIAERLKQVIDWSQIKALHYFEPIRELFEVDTSDFITYIEDEYPDLHLSTSRKIEDVWELICVRGDKPSDKFDVIIVPMLGFDKDLQRIGYGGGYYDKFLAGQPQAQKVGVCFAQGKVEHIPTELHDIPLDIIVTNNEIFTNI